jgi:preprotein translocase subunit SecG
MTTQLLLIIHVIVCLGIIGLVLIQHGKGADAGAAFGSGASGTVFGSGGSASFLTRLTALFATGFFISSMLLAMFAGTYESGESVVTGAGQRVSVDDGESESATDAGDSAPAPADSAQGSSGSSSSSDEGGDSASPAPAPAGSGDDSERSGGGPEPAPAGS